MNSSTKSCLSGVRVLDLTRVFAGPWCTQSLADLGAEVVKIERPGAGHDSRRPGPTVLDRPRSRGRGQSAFYLSANRNKKSVALDISTPQGREVIRRLYAQVDSVVVENYKVGTLARYGLDASLREINPRLVYCSITGFGQTGPLKHRPGASGLRDLPGDERIDEQTGEPDGAPGARPQRIQLVVSDLMTGMYATQGILAALHYRDCHSGVGQHIDIALLDAESPRCHMQQWPTWCRPAARAARHCSADRRAIAALRVR